MEFNLAEKLAIVKALDRVILADKKIKKSEMAYLGQLMRVMDFDSDFVEEARKFNVKQSNSILKEMTAAKKRSLTIMLNEMAYADGNLNKQELEVLLSIFERAGINLEEPDEIIPEFDLAAIYFKSRKQVHHTNSYGNQEIVHSKRAVKIEPHIEEKEGYSVTIFQLNTILPFWGNKVELPPKQMKPRDLEYNKTFLEGYSDGSSTKEDDPTNYGLSIFHKKSKIEKIILHNYYKKLDIEFLE